MSIQDSFCSVNFLADLISNLDCSESNVLVLNKKLIDGLKKVAEDLRQAKEFDFRKIGDHRLLKRGNG